MIPPIHLRKTEIQGAEIFESETKSLTTKSQSVPNFTSKQLLSLPKIPKNISTGSLKNYGETQGNQPHLNMIFASDFVNFELTYMDFWKVVTTFQGGKSVILH